MQRVVESLWQDLRFAGRSFVRTPGFTAVAVFTLGLGIGATTTMFSVVNATLLRPLPFDDPEALAMVYLTSARPGVSPVRTRWSYPEFQMLRETAEGFSGLAVFTIQDFNIVGDGEPEHVEGEVVSASYLGILGVETVLGRGFLPQEDGAPGTHPVVLLGHGLWQRLMGGNRAVVGQTIRVNRTPLTVVGVLPPGFRGLSGRADLWVPQALGPVVGYPNQLTDEQHFHNVVARLDDGVTVGDAVAQLDIVGERIAGAFEHGGDARWSATVVGLDQARIDPTNRRSQLILMGAVTLVLLIACANLVNLLLARAITRRREVAIRLALGSSRGRLIRQLLTESVVLALVGGVAGALLAMWVADGVAAFAPPRLASASNDYAQLGAFAPISIDWTVLAFSASTAMGTGVLFGLAPALRATRPNLTGALKEGGPGFGEGQPSNTSGILIVSEFALAAMLLVGAVLLLLTYSNLQSRDDGFDANNVLTFWIQPAPSQYRGDRAPAFVEEVLERVSSVPGVDGATVGLCTPLMSACARTVLQIAGRVFRDPPAVGRHYVGPDHFRTLGIRVLRGRPLTADDRAGRPRVALINETAARTFWPDDDPIGQRVWFGVEEVGHPDSAFEVVGIVGDVHYGDVDDDTRPDFYTSYLQFTWPYTYVMVRTAEPMETTIPALRKAVAGVDPELPLYDIQPLADRVGQALARPRFHALLLGSFAAVAVALAAIGIYGVMTHYVTHRVAELGLRIALGAEAGDVLGLILGRGFRLVAAGAVAGLLGSVAITRVLASLLYEVNPNDPRILIAILGLLSGVALAACYFPARRAARVDPMSALKRE